ncbi:MAG: hypothetical protein ACREI3_11510 [Nitrospirales bacterium]
MTRCILTGFMLFAIQAAAPAWPSPAVAAAEPELEIEITKTGLGKQVVIQQGGKEWFMMIEVTPSDTVIIRQEIDNGEYLVDESETHDRPMTVGEVDAAIEAFVNSVKTRVNQAGGGP